MSTFDICLFIVIIRVLVRSSAVCIKVSQWVGRLHLWHDSYRGNWSSDQL